MTVSRRDFVAAVVAAGAVSGVASVAQAADKCCASTPQKKDAAVFVVATVTVKEGKRDEFVKIFKDNVPNVLAENGCVFYEPVVDMQSGIDIQDPLRSDVMVVMEKWESLDALLVHLDAPHMNTYREAVKDLVTGVKLQVLECA